MTETPKALLIATIDQLYQVFSTYPLAEHVMGCLHCVSEADQITIHQRPLRELTGTDLERFAFKAITTWGGVLDLKHFLPRLLELAAWEGSVGETDLEILFGKLNYAQWLQWSESEVEAVRQYLNAVWDWILSTPVEDVFTSSLKPSEDSYLCAIGTAEDDLSEYLKIWQASDSLSAMLHLSRFILENLYNLMKKRALVNPFWREGPMRQTVEWLVDPSLVSSLEQTYFRFADFPQSQFLSLAITALEALHPNQGSRLPG